MHVDEIQDTNEHDETTPVFVLADNLTGILESLTVQDKDNVCMLLVNIKLICTRCETCQKRKLNICSLLYLFRMLVQMNISTMYIYCILIQLECLCICGRSMVSQLIFTNQGLCVHNVSMVPFVVRSIIVTLMENTHIVIIVPLKQKITTVIPTCTLLCNL